MAIGTAVRNLRGDGRGRTLLAIAFGWVFVLGGRFLVPSVLPQVKTAFGVGDLGAGVAVTIIWGGYAVMQSPAGLLVDRLGERLLLAGSLLLTAGSVLVIGLAPVFVAFLVGCGAFGLATGLYGPARGTALSRTFPEHDGAAIGATLAAGSIGSAVLPFLAGAFVETAGWRLVVAGLAPPLLAVTVFAWRSVPPRPASTTPPAAAPRDLAGDMLDAVRTKGVAIAGAAVTLMIFVFQGVSAFYVTYLVTAKPFSQTVAAGMFALVFLGGAIAQLGGGALADRVGERWLLVGVSAAGVPLLAAVPSVAGFWPVALLSVSLGSRLAVSPITNAYIIDVLPAEVQGVTWGTLRTVFFLLGAGGSTLVGALADRGRFDAALYLLAALTGLAAVLYAFLPTRAAARTA